MGELAGGVWVWHVLLLYLVLMFRQKLGWLSCPFVLRHLVSDGVLGIFSSFGKSLCFQAACLTRLVYSGCNDTKGMGSW